MFTDLTETSIGRLLHAPWPGIQPATQVLCPDQGLKLRPFGAGTMLQLTEPLARAGVPSEISVAHVHLCSSIHEVQALTYLSLVGHNLP